MDTVNLAIVGATGAVGEAVVELLQESTFPVDQLYLLASERTAGTSLLFRSKPLMVNIIESFDFSQVDMAIFVATDAVSEQYVPNAQAAGCVVIDNSPVFANKQPLIIPNVNAGKLAADNKPSLVVNPDSTVVALCTVLKPIEDAAGIKRINLTTYDSVSRHGKKAIHELATQTASLLNGQGAEPSFFPQQIAFNVLPSVGDIEANGHSESENRIYDQLMAVMSKPNILCNVSCSQVPVFYADSFAVQLETDAAITVDQVEDILKNHNEINVLNSEEQADIVTPVTTAAGKNTIYVSRIRANMSGENGVSLWIVADNVKKGAAYNTILIAEELKKTYL